MITYAEGGRRFNFRVAGIAIRDGRVLLHRAPDDPFWTLPGGRAEMLEFTPDTLRRELFEEIRVRVEVGRLLWVAENFFAYAGADCHEICFYYTMTLPSDAARDDEFLGSEGAMHLHFRWTPLEEVPAVNLLPSFLREGLAALPQQTVHLMHVDRGS